MNQYIFYTPEGSTTGPNDIIEVENCQVLGIAKGKNENEARLNLLKENPWITEAGFNSDKFINRRLAI